MKKLYFTFLISVISLSNGFSQLTFTVTPSMTDLTNYFQGIGLTITNMTVTGAPSSFGFYSGSSNMAFGSGVIMSTGIVDSTINSPASVFLNTDNSKPGDALLDVVSGAPTFDACIIEFDCVPTNSNLLFDFSFGSEEYNEFVNVGVNDVFAIFVSGTNPAGGNYTNVNFALIPSTTIPVSINTVNNGNGAGPCMNCAYFIDNYNGTSVAYDAFTTGLQGLVQVVPGQTYHFKIAIADAGDGIFDSSVMFLTNSFKSLPSTPTSILEAEKESNLSIYPNPTSTSVVQIDVKEDVLKTLELYSYQGRNIENITFDKNKNTLQLNNVAKGLYFLHVITNKGKTVKKLVIE